MGWTSDQKKFLNTRHADRVLLVGSVRSGKSFMMNSFVSYLASFDCRGAIVGKTYESLRENVLNPLRKMYGDFCIYKRGGKEISLFGKTYRGCAAYDDKSWEKIMGDSFGWAYCDELVTYPESFYNVLSTRLDKFPHRLYATTNPGHANHWLKKAIDAGSFQVFDFALKNNSFVPDRYKKRIEKDLPSQWRKRLIENQWVSLSGLIYGDSFDPERHLFAGPNPYPKNRPFVAIDYGTTNPFVALYFVQKGNDIYILDEFYYSSKEKNQLLSDVEYMERFRKWLPDGLRPKIIIDPSAASFKTMLRKLGYVVTNAKNEVLEGIREVMSAFAANKLHIHEKCEHTIEELGLYAWDSKALEDRPLKENDHCMDALRYAVHSKKYKTQKQKFIL